MKDFKGKYTDTNYLKNPPNTWQNAKNILLTDKFNSPVNENGTKFNHLIEGRVLGIIETNEHIVYFSVLADVGDSIISLYEYNTSLVSIALRGDFGFSRPIEGVYKYDFKGDLIISWCDGVWDDSNSMKIAQVTNSELPLDSNKVLRNEHLDLISLFPNVNKGNIDSKQINGSIDGIYAYPTFRYGYKDSQTQFKNINNSLSLNELKNQSSQPVSKGIKVCLSDLDFEVYEYIEIGLYIVGEESNNSYLSKRFNIKSSSLEIDINSLTDFTDLSNEELIAPRGRFTKGETITDHKESILIGKVEREAEFRFQKYANLLTISPTSFTTDEDGTTLDFDNNTKILQHSEVYSFKVQLDLKNGETTEWFHIPNLEIEVGQNGFAFNNTSFKDKFALDLNRFDSAQRYRQFHFDNKGSLNKFGLWRNEETYPDNDEYNSTVDYDGNPLNGLDLRNRQVGYHRVMDEDVLRANPFLPIEESIVIQGVKIDNFDVIPLSVRNQILNVRLGFAKRDLGNSLVVSNGILLPMTLSEGFQDYVKLLTNSETPLVPSIIPTEDFPGQTFNKALFLSTDLQKTQAKFDFNVTQVKGIGPKFDTHFSDDSYFEERATTIDNYQEVLNKNKYYFGYDSYTYKLPNNQAQGSQYTDGGLVLHYTDEKFNLLKKSNDFLPNIQQSELQELLTNSPQANTNKLITLPNSQEFVSTRLTVAHVSLLNFKDNLYNLNSTEIVSSFNSFALDSNFNLNSNSIFRLGDVSYSRIEGGLNTTIVNEISIGNATVTSVRDFFTRRLKFKTLSVFSNALMKARTLSTEDSLISRGLDTSSAEDIELLNSVPYGYDTDFSTNNSGVNDIAAFESFDINNNYIDYFEDLIIRSAIAPEEGDVINSLRTFFVNNYYYVGGNRGDIVALRSNDVYLFIQLRFNLLYAEVKDVITTQDTDAFLENRDIFDRPPTSITLAPNGYIGSEHKFSCKMTKEGYLVIDHKQGIIAICTPQVKIISSIGLRNDLYDDLEFIDLKYFEELKGKLVPIDDPYKFIGFSVGYDREFNRVFISKLFPEINLINSNEELNIIKSDFYKELLNNNSPNLNIPLKLNNKDSFCLSYSLDTDFWLNNHDLISNSYIEFRKNLYALRNVPYQSQGYDTGVIHQVNRGQKGMYFGRRFESYIDLIFNSNPNITKTYDLIEIISEVVTSEIGSNKHKTIDSIIVFNDNQCSDEIILDVENFDKVRNAEGSWKVNNFRDIIIDSNFPILKEGGEINKDNLNNTKEWFDMSYFISKFIVVRLIWKNTNNDSVYLNEVNLVSKISKR